MGDFLFWPGGGSGSGGTLVVTAPAGTTVIATNEALGKTVTKRVNDEGIATIKGLKSGTWMLSVTDGAITSTPVPVEIVADYTQTLAFFSAEINVTYPVGSTVTCTCGEVQLVSTQVEDANGSAKFVVPNAGIWTITSTANDGSGKSKSAEMEITAEGQSVSVELLYEFYVYNRGDECVEVSGGWISTAQGLSAEAPNANALTITKTATTITGTQKTSLSNGVLHAKNKIDLTGVKTIVVRFLGNGTSYGRTTFRVLSSLSNYLADYAVASVNPTTTMTDYELDVSELSGEFYVGFNAYSASNYVTAEYIKCIC